MKIPFVAFSFVVFGWAMQNAHAETLMDVYNAAQNFDATYLAAKSQEESASYKAAQTRALMRPSLNATAGYTHSEIDPPPSDRAPSITSQIALQGKQPLLNQANRLSIDQAERTLEISRHDLQIAKQDLMVRTAQAYFDVLAAQDGLTTAQANKKAISEQLASAKRSFEVGAATITDSREAQARFDLSRAQELAADNDLHTKQIALEQLVGRPSVRPNALTKPVVMAATEPADIDAWVRWADNAPTVRKAKLAFEIARIEVSKSQAGHWPTLDAITTLSHSHTTGEGASLATRGNTDSGSVGIQLALPVYAGNAITNRVKETISLEEKTRHDLEAAQRLATQNTRQTFLGVQSGLAQIQALEAAEASSKLALDATQLGYKVGVRVNLDVLNAQTQLFTTQRDLAKARYDVIVNQLKLRQNAGTLEPTDISRINQMISSNQN